MMRLAHWYFYHSHIPMELAYLVDGIGQRTDGLESQTDIVDPKHVCLPHHDRHYATAAMTTTNTDE